MTKCLERLEDLRDRKETRKFYEAVKLTRKDFYTRDSSLQRQR
jgi:hypothetical protein